MTAQKKKLAVGDRVKIRGYSSGGHCYDGMKGAIKKIHPRFVDVEMYFDQSLRSFKPSQLIRLIKKQRRKIWIHENCIPTSPYSEKATISAGELVGEEFVCFIEVRKK